MQGSGRNSGRQSSRTLACECAHNRKAHGADGHGGCDLSKEHEGTRATNIEPEFLVREQETAHCWWTPCHCCDVAIYLTEMETHTLEPAIPDNLEGHYGTLSGPPLPSEMERRGKAQERKHLLDFGVFERRMARDAEGFCVRGNGDGL